MDALQEKVLNRFLDFESRLNGSKKEEIHQSRLTALDAIRETGFPHRKSEEWKYTFISKKLEKFIDSSNAGVQNIDVSKFTFESDRAIQLYNINGKWNDPGSIELPQGLEILPFTEAKEKFTEAFYAHFDRIREQQGNAFGALNTAFVEDGLFIHVSRGAAIEEEVVLHFINDSRDGEFLTQPRVLVVCEDGSQLTIIEQNHLSGDAGVFSNACTEISVAQNANIKYYKLQLEDGEFYHTGNTAVNQEKGSVFTAYTITLNGTMVRNNLDIHLMDEHIETNMFGVYLLNGKSHVDNHTTVNHAFPNCHSNELYKGIMNDSSTAVFNGKIYVRKDAQKTNAFQSNRNLLLSPDATVHTKPQLEIWADDVKCSHGATIGQLDEEQLFYLRSRGISKEDALALLTHAFLEEVIEKMDVDFVKNYIENSMNERLHFDL
jgi:Fe-S cluster assembly protein SufD